MGRIYPLISKSTAKRLNKKYLRWLSIANSNLMFRTYPKLSKRFISLISLRAATVPKNGKDNLDHTPIKNREAVIRIVHGNKIVSKRKNSQEIRMN